MEKSPTTTLQARLDPGSKRVVEAAARLRHVGLTDYIRLVLVSTARREVEAAKQNVLQMTAEEQEKFWEALHAPAHPTPAQIRLGKIARGKL